MGKITAAGDIASLERSFTTLGRVFLNLYATRYGAPPEALDRTSYFALVLLDEKGPMRVSELAGSIGLDVSTVSRSLSQLGEGKLVEKARDLSDGRVCVIAISEDGRKVLERHAAAKREILGEATVDWDGADCRILAESMARLAESLGAMRR